MKNYFKFLLDIIFPVHCPVCGRIVSKGNGLICRECSGAFISTGSIVCKKCGKPVACGCEYCSDCGRKQHLFARNFAMWIYEDKMQRSIAHFKYHDRPEYAGYYASEISKRFKKQIALLKIDAIVPVPLYIKRKKHRGYNQAELLSRELGRILEIPVYPGLLIRIKKTKPQKNLNDLERQRNLKDAFAWNKALQKKGKMPVNIKRVLLVDDIYTTGSTLDACSRVLLENGVDSVYGMTISIGIGNG